MKLKRSFGRPGTLDPAERVWLVIEGLSSGAIVWLNEAELAASGPPQTSVRCDVTELLRGRNQLLVEWGAETALPELVGPVRLEIVGG